MSDLGVTVTSRIEWGGLVCETWVIGLPECPINTVGRPAEVLGQLARQGQEGTVEVRDFSKNLERLWIGSWRPKKRPGQWTDRTRTRRHKRLERARDRRQAAYQRRSSHG